MSGVPATMEATGDQAVRATQIPKRTRSGAVAIPSAGTPGILVVGSAWGGGMPWRSVCPDATGRRRRADSCCATVAGGVAAR